MMKRVNYSLMRSLFAFMVGLVLVWRPDIAAKYIVIVIGLGFFIPGFINIVNCWLKRKKTTTTCRFPIEGMGSTLFGLWLIIMPDFFADVLLFLLGLTLVIGGVQQIASLTVAKSWIPIPPLFYFFPVIILVIGIIALFNPTGVRNTAFMIMGVAGMAYGIVEFINWFRFMRHRPLRKELDDSDDVESNDQSVTP